MREDAISLKPGLYVTATPIGNLGDITYRAVEIMKGADLILCEDTRQTAKLCAAYDIKTPRTAYQEHNAARVRPEIVKRLESGGAVCLVSDAGTPLIADPGFKLVREAVEAGVDVFPVPGPSAVIAALSASGAPSDRFTFGGFPPPKKGARRKFFDGFADTRGTLVFYETGNRLGDSLADMKDALGDREAVVARELTKIHETFYRGALGTLASDFADATPKGEIVVLVFPKAEAAPDESEVNSFLCGALSQMSVKEAAAAAAEKFSMPRRIAYERALALRDNAAPGEKP